jgi:hypothetical protein
MCDVLLPPGVNPTAVIYIYHIISKPFPLVHDRHTCTSVSEFVSDCNFRSVWQRVVEQSFDGTRGQIGKNVCLAEEFNSYLRNAVTDLEMKAAEQLHSDVLMMFVKVSALYVLNCNLFGATDKKLFRQLWDLNKKVIVILQTLPFFSPFHMTILFVHCDNAFCYSLCKIRKITIFVNLVRNSFIK